MRYAKLDIKITCPDTGTFETALQPKPMKNDVDDDEQHFGV